MSKPDPQTTPDLQKEIKEWQRRCAAADGREYDQTYWDRVNDGYQRAKDGER